MQALSQEILAGNAFRVLGLPADAGQAAIDSAARRMRIWSNPARIPPTPWDLPWLGPLPRGRSDIEMALARLADPVSRLNQRLFWFALGDSVRPMRRPGRIFGHVLAPSSGGAPADRFFCASHDAAKSRLASALIADPEIRLPRRWGGALVDFCQSAASLHYLNWLVSIETAGKFEKKAGLEEILAALAGLSGSIAESLATWARDALDRDRADACMRLVGLLRAAGPDEVIVSVLHAALHPLPVRKDSPKLPNLRELEQERQKHELALHPPAPLALPLPESATASWESFFHPPATQPDISLPNLLVPATFPFDQPLPEVGGIEHTPATEPSSIDRSTTLP